MMDILKLRGFRGVDRTVSGVDVSKAGQSPADVMENLVIDPLGRLTLREGYTSVYPDYPTLFDHTTPPSQRYVLEDAVPFHYQEIYSAVHKKTLIVHKSESNYYLYMACAVADKGTGVTTLHIWRGIGDLSTGEVQWEGSYELGASQISQTIFNGDEGNSNRVYLDFSMVWGGGDIIYLALLKRDDTRATNNNPNWAELKIYSIANVTTGNWPGDVTVNELRTLESIDGYSAVMGVDMDIDSTNNLHVVYEYYESQTEGYYVKYHNYNNNATISINHKHYRSPRIIVGRLGDYEKYVITAIDEDHKIVMSVYGINTDPTNELGEIENIPQGSYGDYPFLEGAVSAVGGDKVHLLYRNNQGGLIYAQCAEGGGNAIHEIITQDLPALNYDGGIIAGTVPITLSCWDMILQVSPVEKENWITIYYTKPPPQPFMSQGMRLVRKWKYGSEDWSPEYVVEGNDQEDLGDDHTYGGQNENQDSNRTFYAYLAAYRRDDEGTGVRRLGYILTHYNQYNGEAHRDLKYCRNGRTAAEGRFNIEAITEFVEPQVEGEGVRYHIVHCGNENNEFYKRHPGVPEWILLENSYLPDNSDQAWWRRLAPSVEQGGLGLTKAPDPDDHCRFISEKGELRMAMGTNRYAVPGIYQFINRYIWTNNDYDHYQGMYLDLQPLTPPMPDNLPDDAFTYIRPGHTLNLDIFANCDFIFLQPDKYRAFGGFTADDGALRHPIMDSEFQRQDGIVKSGIDQSFGHAQAYFAAFSYVYDGREESQLYVVPKEKTDRWNVVFDYSIDDRLSLPDGAVWCGGVQFLENGAWYLVPYLAVRFRMRHWNDTRAERSSPRITAVRVWLQEVTHSKQTPEDGIWFPVKTIAVGLTRNFLNEMHNGEVEWNWDADGGYYNVTIPIDLDDILVGKAAGEYSRINGHEWVEFKREEGKGLLQSPYPEGYKYQVFCNSYSLIGNIRWNGVLRPNAVALSTMIAEQGYSAVMRDTYNEVRAFPFDIGGLIVLDDQTVAVIGENGRLRKMEVPSLTVRGDIMGSDEPVPPDSVGMVGGGLIYMSGQKLISIGDRMLYMTDPIVNSAEHESSLHPGLKDMNVLGDAWVFYVPPRRRLVMFLPTENKTWIYDFTVRAWTEMSTSRNFRCGTLDINGGLIVVDSNSIVRDYFQAGEIDDGEGITPLFITPPVDLPGGYYLEPTELWLTYSSNENVKVHLIRNRGELTATELTFPSTQSLSRVRRRIGAGVKVSRDLGLKITTEQPANVFILEEVVLRGNYLEII